jgi:hypothetical protein
MDLERIQLDQPGEAARRAAEFGIDEDTLAAAIAAVGPEVEKVKSWLASPERYVQQDARVAQGAGSRPAGAGTGPRGAPGGDGG